MDDYIFHIPYGAAEPEVCAHPSTCSLNPHARGIEAAEQMMESRNLARQQVPLPFTKADLPMIRKETQR